MKTGKSIFWGVLFSCMACLFGMASCDSQPTEEKAQAALEKKGGMVLTFAPDMDAINALSKRFETQISEEEIQEGVNNSHYVLQHRLKQFGAKKAFVKVTDDNQIIAIVPDVKNPARVRRLLKTNGHLEFWETYENSEVYPMLKQLNDQLLEYDNKEVFGDKSLFDLLHPYVTEEGEARRGPAVGLVNSEDRPRVIAMLNCFFAKMILPRDLRLTWAAKPEQDGSYQLIALKAMPSDQAALELGHWITSVKAVSDKQCPYPVIEMEMNKAGAECWQRMTRENIGKSIAIVVDGLVYSYPTVQCEIAGGKSQITGNFTDEEAEDLANILNYGGMPCPLRIIEEQDFEPQK